MTKPELRAALLAQRRAMAPEKAAGRSRDVHARIRRIPGWTEMRVVLVYLPFQNEVDTWALIHELWARDAQTLAPCCCPGCPGEMDFFHFQSIQDLRPGPFNILEPEPSVCASGDPLRCDCVLVPGAGFDRQGFRLGFGGGYYDRLLPRLGADTRTIGLAYDFQLLNALPREPHDYPVQVICTDKETVWAQK